jgi:hypothetical protein
MAQRPRFLTGYDVFKLASKTASVKFDRTRLGSDQESVLLGARQLFNAPCTQVCGAWQIITNHEPIVIPRIRLKKKAAISPDGCSTWKLTRVQIHIDLTLAALKEFYYNGPIDNHLGSCWCDWVWWR